MNLFKIASRVALPMTRMRSIDEDALEIQTDPREEAKYRKFFKAFGVDIQVLQDFGSAISAEPSESRYAPFLEPGVVTIVEGFSGAQDTSPAWLVHDALGHSSGSETFWTKHPDAIRKIEIAFGKDFGIESLVNGTQSLYSPVNSLLEFVPKSFWPRRNDDPTDIFAEIAVKYVKDNGKLLEFPELPAASSYRIKKLNSKSGGRESEEIMIFRNARNRAPGPTTISPQSLPEITNLINEILRFTYDRIRDYLDSKKGSFITDKPGVAEDYPDLFNTASP